MRVCGIIFVVFHICEFSHPHNLKNKLSSHANFSYEVKKLELNFCNFGMIPNAFEILLLVLVFMYTYVYD